MIRYVFICYICFLLIITGRVHAAPSPADRALERFPNRRKLYPLIEDVTRKDYPDGTYIITYKENGKFVEHKGYIVQNFAAHVADDVINDAFDRLTRKMDDDGLYSSLKQFMAKNTPEFTNDKTHRLPKRRQSRAEAALADAAISARQKQIVLDAKKKVLALYDQIQHIKSTGMLPGDDAKYGVLSQEIKQWEIIQRYDLIDDALKEGHLHPSWGCPRRRRLRRRLGSKQI